MSEVVRLPNGGTIFLCSRGKPPSCRGLGKPAGRFTVNGEKVWLCGDTGCRQEVDVYEAADGRMIAHRHIRRASHDE